MKCALRSFLSFTEDLLSLPFRTVLPGGPCLVEACLQEHTMMSISDISSLSFKPKRKNKIILMGNVIYYWLWCLEGTKSLNRHFIDKGVKMLYNKFKLCEPYHTASETSLWLVTIKKKCRALNASKILTHLVCRSYPTEYPSSASNPKGTSGNFSKMLDMGTCDNNLSLVFYVLCVLYVCFMSTSINSMMPQNCIIYLQ